MSDDNSPEERINSLRKRVEEVAAKDGAAAVEFAVMNFGANFESVAIKAFLAGVRHGRKEGAP